MEETPSRHAEETIRGWDAPTRIFHWLLAGAVVGAVVTVKLGGNWMVWHERFGLTVVGLLVFRLLWGFIGSTYARFGAFFPTPGRLLAWFRGRWHRPGHTPLGGLSILAMLLVLGFQATSGLFADDDIAFTGPLRRLVSSDTSSLLTAWHMRMEWVIYTLVALHIAAVMLYQFAVGKNLIGPMVSGHMPADQHESNPARGGGPVALIIALAISAAVAWVASGGLLGPPPQPTDLGW